MSPSHSTRPRPAWLFPEYTPVGIDLGSKAAVAAYDRNQGTDPDADDALHRAGFLDYDHRAEPADVVTSKAALHQLPDFFKQQALLNAAGMLRRGGTFYLWDVVFSFEPATAPAHVQRWIDTAGRPAGEGFTRADFEAHVREEFSTYTWIMEGMLDRAGFDIVSSTTPRPTHADFHCLRR
ncbi:hypothetical protein [Streptomyces sp. WG-D5]